MTGHLQRRVDLEIERPGAIRDNEILMDVRLEMDPVAPPGKQIDRRSAMERKVVLPDRVLQNRIAPIEKNQHLQLVSGAAPDRGTEVADLDEEKPRRKREILVQQAIALEGTRAVR